MILSDIERRGFTKEDMFDKPQASRGKTTVSIEKIYRSRIRAEKSRISKDAWYTWSDKECDVTYSTGK